MPALALHLADLTTGYDYKHVPIRVGTFVYMLRARPWPGKGNDILQCTYNIIVPRFIITPTGRSGQCAHYAPVRSGDRTRATPMKKRFACCHCSLGRSWRSTPTARYTSKILCISGSLWSSLLLLQRISRKTWSTLC